MASRPGTPRGHTSRPGTPRGHTSRPGTPHGHTSPSPLSIRHFSSTEEYMSVIRNGLSDWLNSLYDLNLTPDDLVECLSTGVVLCHHANTCEVESGTDYRVHFSPRATQGSFQARDNVSLFIDWCRHSLQFPETLLFETNDLVEGRNEHNFLVCLLEVARTGAQVGLPEPVFDLPDMCVEKFATGPLSSIQLSYSGKKVPSTESKRDSGTTPPVHKRGGAKNGHPSTDRTETERPRTRPHQRAVSSDGTPAGNDVSSPDKATGNNVMMVVRDSRGKHTVLRNRTEPVDLQAKNYQLVCADTVELPTNQDTLDRDAKLHVMAAIPNMEAKPGDDVFVGKSAATNSEFVAQKTCPVHGRSSSLDDVDLAHGQLPHAPKEKTSRTARRWSDGFQTQRIVGRRDSGKSPSERVLSKVSAKSSGHFESPFMQSDRQVSSPRRGSLGCSVCPRHSDAEQPESLESFWERLSRPKTRRKSLPSGLPTVSENQVARPRPKSADARLHMRRGTFPINSSKEQLSISPRGFTKNGYPSTDRNEPERPRARPGSAMAKLGGPTSPPQSAREKERPLSARYTIQKTQDDLSVKTQNTKETTEERNRTGGLSNGNCVKERTSISPKSIRGRNAFPGTSSNGPESPRPRPRSAMAKLERPSSPPQNANERGRPLAGRIATKKLERPSSPSQNASERGRPLAGRIAEEKAQNIPSDIRKEALEERNRTGSFPNKERTSISPRGNTESVKNSPSPKPRPRSAMGKLEATISPPGEKDGPLTRMTLKEKTTPSFAPDSSRKEALAERNGSGKGNSRIPLERANSFVIKEKSAQNEALNRTANHHRETTGLSSARSKSLPLIDEVFDNKRQESFTFGGSKSTRPTDTGHSMSESFKQNNSYYSTSIAISDHTLQSRTVAGGSHERRRVSDSYAVVGRHRTEVDREVYEDFLKEVNGRKKSPAVSKRLSSPTVDRQVTTTTTTVDRQTLKTTAKTYNNSNGHAQHHSNAYSRETNSGQNYAAVDRQVTTTVDRQISTTAKPYNSNAYSREANSRQNHEAEETTDSSSSGSGDDTSPDQRRSSLRPCTPVPSDHKLPRTVSPRQDPVPWPPSKIPRPTFYAEPDETEGFVSPSACSNAKNLQDFLDYLHKSNALQRSDSVSLTSDSSEGSTLI